MISKIKGINSNRGCLLYKDYIGQDDIIQYTTNPSPIKETNSVNINITPVSERTQPLYSYVRGVESQLSFTIYVWPEKLTAIGLNDSPKEYINKIMALKDPMPDAINISPSPPYVNFVFVEDRMGTALTKGSFHYCGYVQDISVDYKYFENSLDIRFAQLDLAMLLVKKNSQFGKTSAYVPKKLLCLKEEQKMHMGIGNMPAETVRNTEEKDSGRRKWYPDGKFPGPINIMANKCKIVMFNHCEK